LFEIDIEGRRAKKIKIETDANKTDEEKENEPEDEIDSIPSDGPDCYHIISNFPMNNNEALSISEHK